VVSPTAGLTTIETGAVVVATGCRERSAKQIFLQGTRPAGVITAGLAQYFINIMGYLPGRRCVILGSGDIGLIMARRLVLEGAEVAGVYEILPEPSGLTRNIVQCLDDYGIGLHLRKTVTRVHGSRRVEAVTVSSVDERGRPVKGTEEEIPCDTLVLSVGLIPENDLLHPLGLELDPITGGPAVDQTGMTGIPGLFSCGNALQVNDLVDYVSESGRAAGAAAARFAEGGTKASEKSDSIPVIAEGNIRTLVPQRVDVHAPDPWVFYFRSSKSMDRARLSVTAGGREILSTELRLVRPPEIERIEVDPSDLTGRRTDDGKKRSGDAAGVGGTEAVAAGGLDAGTAPGEVPPISRLTFFLEEVE
jgi:thioredoxin reductase